MKNNHEIRFTTSAEAKEMIITLKENFPELSLNSFNEKIYLLGLNNLKNQLIKNKNDYEETLVQLVRIKK